MVFERSRKNFVILNVYGPPSSDIVVIDENNKDYDNTSEKRWAHTLCLMASRTGEILALDKRKTTTGDDNGIYVVIERERLPVWKRCAGMMGLSMSIEKTPIRNGRYGYGSSAACIVSIEQDQDNCFWVN